MKHNYKKTWTVKDPRWLALDDYQKAAAMALMEADGADSDDAKNALAAMMNRAAKYKAKLGDHVSSQYYQPAMEKAQQARLDSILKNPNLTVLIDWAKRYAAGQEADPVNGATHFLAHPQQMFQLSKGVRPNPKGSGYVGNSSKYFSWPQWSGFDPKTFKYKNQTISDKSHSFLAPEGLFSLVKK